MDRCALGGMGVANRVVNDLRSETRDHAEDGLDCWCEPFIAYEDDDARVIVHHHWVNGEVRDGEDG